MIIRRNLPAFLLLFLFPITSVNAYWVWSPQAGKFVNADGQGQDAAEEKYDYALKLYRDRNLDQAEEQFENVVKQFPNTKTAPEALYRLAIIQEEKGDYLKAFKTYRKLVQTYPQSDRFVEVIEREFKIGNLFLAGKKARIAGLEILPSLPKAAEIFKHISEDAPYSDYGDKAHFQLGLTYKKMKRWGDAAQTFQNLVDRYPKSSLLAQARFQLAESSYLRSGAEFRDQRALDEASRQVDRFLNAYPESSASEEAAKLRQEIDEKNAEKNYRIGLYYEKENYLESALLYYQDVSTRYSHTKWGEKSLEKLKSLKQPSAYHSQKEKEINDEEESAKAEVTRLEKGTDPVALDIARRKLERIQKNRKDLDKNKKENLERRKQDLNRRERELKEKFKNLETKRKLLKKNPSEDLKRAIDRWHASLVSEQDDLIQEKNQLQGWREELGVKERKLDMGFLPFIGEEPSEIERVRQIEAKNFYKISEKKKSVLEEKELLFKHYGEVSSQIEQIDQETAPNLHALGYIPEDQEPSDLRTIRLQIEDLEKQAADKKETLEKKYGHKTIGRIGESVRDSVARSVSVLNPFDGNEDRDTQSLLERQMHLEERIATQQNLVQTLNSAFEAQLAATEKRRLLAAAKNQPKEDPLKMRKEVKNLERRLRKSYEEIETHHNLKKEYLDNLSGELKQKDREDKVLNRTGRTLAAPALGAGRFMKAFLFGLPHREVELTKSAERVPAGPDTAQIKELEEKIRQESLLIDAKSREIQNLQKELEALKARASISGGYKFRPLFIKAPYLFVEEAIDSARRVIPRKSREELLINRLHEETQKLQELNGELKKIESRLALNSPKPAKTQPVLEKKSEPASEQQASDALDRQKLERELKDISARIEDRKKAYQKGRESLENISREKKEKQINTVKEKAKKIEQGRQLRSELKDLQDEIREIINQEKKLEEQESSILDKRIVAIDKTLKAVQSKSLSQDLLNERGRMESRLTQLESRKDFLSQELKRFEPMDPAKAGA